MLHLYQSNRLEYLAAMLEKVQRVQALPHPLIPEEIVVQSRGMRRYISQYLARETGIAANLRFSLPAGLAWRLMREAVPDIPELNPFSSEVVRWRLLGLFESEAFAKNDAFAAARSALAGYLNGGAYSAYQLAGQLADVFDQYLVYRPEWIEAWAAGRRAAGLENDAGEIWQAELWRFLDDGRQGVPHRVKLWRMLMQWLDVPQPNLPQRFCVFGIATLAPMYLRLLAQIARHADVHIFALNPSAEYWGNLSDPAQAADSGGDTAADWQGHPLLASLGKQGRDFFNELAESETRLALEAFDESPDSGSLLHGIQHQIQTQTLPETAQAQDWAAQHTEYLRADAFPENPEAGQDFQAALTQAQNTLAQGLADIGNRLSGSLKTAADAYLAKPDGETRAALAACAGSLKTEAGIRVNKLLRRYAEAAALAGLQADPSIRITAAHSPLRELQILKDHLIALLARHPDWQPHDIAVLAPHIDPYAPYIETVFGRHSPHPLPYTVSDIRIARRQPLLDALEQAITLAESRFEAPKLLALAESAPVLAAFGLTRDDLPLLRDTAEQLNIRWGSGKDDRAEHGSRDKLFTWQQGLERMVLGFMLPEHPDVPLWQGIAAHGSNPAHLDTLSRFAALVRLLSDTKRQWQQSAPVSEWCTRIRRLAAALLVPETDADRQALQQLETALADWQAQAEAARFTTPIARTAALQHAKSLLGSQSDAGFLRGGITFCSMVPMRSLPFKALCLIGLNDGDFPRNTKAAPFDLIARHPKKGDRARRDDDRYLFLEALLSARETLYLSYTGKDIRTDEARAPSTLLGELLDTVSALSGIPAESLRREWITQHPLQPFSPRYFSGSLKPAGTRQDYAHALAHPQPPDAPFISTAPRQPETQTVPAEPVPQKDFLRFWRNPSAVWLEKTLGWRAPRPEDETQSAEPFAPERKRTLAEAYIRARRTNLDFTALAETLAAQSMLPTGELGTIARNRYAALAAALDGTLLSSPKLPDWADTVRTVSGSLAAVLAHNHADGQILHAAQFLHRRNEQGSLKHTDKTELLLRHLIYCAAAPAEADRRTHYINLGENFTLPPVSAETAREGLAQWLAAYHAGQAAPLPFFPRMSLAAAAEYFKKNDWAAAEKKAAELYYKGYNGFPLADYPEVKLIYGRSADAEPPHRSEAFRRLTENLFAPLAECLPLLMSDGKNKAETFAKTQI